MSLQATFQAFTDDLTALATLCDEGRRHFVAAARTAEDIPSRAICLHKARHCEEMARELQDRVQQRGGSWSPAAEIPDIRSPQKTHVVRCFNWVEGAASRYELALRRPSLPAEDRPLLARHRQWLADTAHHMTPLSDPHLAAA